MYYYNIYIYIHIYIIIYIYIHTYIYIPTSERFQTACWLAAKDLRLAACTRTKPILGHFMSFAILEFSELSEAFWSSLYHWNPLNLAASCLRLRNSRNQLCSLPSLKVNLRRSPPQLLTRLQSRDVKRCQEMSRDVKRCQEMSRDVRSQKWRTVTCRKQNPSPVSWTASCRMFGWTLTRAGRSRREACQRTLRIAG